MIFFVFANCHTPHAVKSFLFLSALMQKQFGACSSKSEKIQLMMMTMMMNIRTKNTNTSKIKIGLSSDTTTTTKRVAGSRGQCTFFWMRARPSVFRSSSFIHCAARVQNTCPTAWMTHIRNANDSFKLSSALTQFVYICTVYLRLTAFMRCISYINKYLKTKKKRKKNQERGTRINVTVKSGLATMWHLRHVVISLHAIMCIMAKKVL